MKNVNRQRLSKRAAAHPKRLACSTNTFSLTQNIHNQKAKITSEDKDVVVARRRCSLALVFLQQSV